MSELANINEAANLTDITFEDRSIAPKSVETMKVMEMVRGAAAVQSPYWGQMAVPTMLVVVLERETYFGRTNPWHVSEWYVQGRKAKADGTPGQRLVRWNSTQLDSTTPYWKRVGEILDEAREGTLDGTE